MRSAASQKRLLELMEAERQRRRGLSSVAEASEEDVEAEEEAIEMRERPILEDTLRGSRRPSLRRVRSGTIHMDGAAAGTLSRTLVRGRSWAAGQGGAEEDPAMSDAVARMRRQVRAGRRGSLAQALAGGRHGRRRHSTTARRETSEWPGPG